MVWINKYTTAHKYNREFSFWRGKRWKLLLIITNRKHQCSTTSDVMTLVLLYHTKISIILLSNVRGLYRNFLGACTHNNYSTFKLHVWKKRTNKQTKKVSLCRDKKPSLSPILICKRLATTVQTEAYIQLPALETSALSQNFPNKDLTEYMIYIYTTVCSSGLIC